MDRPNILLIVMDTTRAKAILSDDGSKIAPHIHNISDDGLIFKNAVTNAPWTLPSHASIFSGQYTSDHNTHAGSKYFSPSNDSLPKALRSVGYQTACFSNNPWISPDFGFDEFDHFTACWKAFNRGANLADVAKTDNFREQLITLFEKVWDLSAPFTVGNAFYMRFLRGVYDSGARRTNRRIQKWLESIEDSQPFFAFVNYMESHLKYDAPRKFKKEFLSKSQLKEAENITQDAWGYMSGNISLDDKDFRLLKKLYWAEINYLDKRIKRLYDYLEAVGELDNTVLFIVGDHGENIGEHGLMDHQYSLYDTLVHVPLMISGYKSSCSKKDHDDIVDLRDLYPTIITLAGGEPTGESVSKVNILNQESLTNRPGYAISEYLCPQPPIAEIKRRYSVDAEFDKYDRALRSIRTENWKYIEGTDGTRKLYNLTEDPGELENIADTHPRKTEEFGNILEEELGTQTMRDEKDVNIDEGTKRSLEDLGYLQ